MQSNMLIDFGDLEYKYSMYMTADIRFLVVPLSGTQASVALSVIGGSLTLPNVGPDFNTTYFSYSGCSGRGASGHLTFCQAAESHHKATG